MDKQIINFEETGGFRQNVESDTLVLEVYRGGSGALMHRKEEGMKWERTKKKAEPAGR